MAEVKFSRDTNRFDFIGLDLNRPVDSVKPGKLPYGKNIRSFLAGRIEPRDGLTDLGQIVAGQSPTHSCRRLNDPNTSLDPNPGGIDWTRIIGAGTHLAYGQAAPYTDADSGYSGNPLALVPWTPIGAPTAYMYVGDSNRMRKIRVGGTLDTVGYAPPNAAPSVALTNSPSYKDIDNFQATAGWAQGGTAGAPSLLSAGPGYRTNSTISQILYDSGTTGWACVQLASMAGVGYGERLEFNPGGGADETATVQSVHAGKSGSTATTIASILYDSGASGACSIALTTPIDQIDIDGLIRDTTVGENVRIVGVVIGPSGILSIRVVTVGTFAAGDNLQVLPSFRVYLVNTHAGGETVRTDGVRTAVTSGTGTLTKTSALDLSSIASGVPTQPDDYMHISLRVDNPQNVTELKAQLDVDISTNDFTRNFYTYSFRASDITPSVQNLQSSLSNQSTINQNNIIDSGTNLPINRTGGEVMQLADAITTSSALTDVTSQQLEPGNSVFVDLRFKIADLVRVGTDDTRSLQNVAALRIVAIVTGSVNLDMDAWWIGGGSGPDTGSTTAVPYLYRYRVRNPTTNVASNFSPATRLALDAFRQSITVTPTQYAAPAGTSLVATNLVLDIERFGGEIAEWHYVSTIPNAASPSYTDTLLDSTVGGNPILDNTNYQPWPVIGVPVTGTTGTVAGTSVADSSTNFNTSWAMGTRILINNLPYTIYRVISTSLLELVENAGSQTAVTWRIDQPTILAQPLPCLWFDEQEGVFFACGDPANPGRLYWSNPSSETTTPANYLDVTSPSEPLMNGLSYNIRSYLFSSDNFFQILATSSFEAIAQNSQLASAPVAYEAQKIPHGKGMFSRWGLTREPSPVICFLAKDGINMTTGGSPIPLTDADLYELFPNEGNLGVTVNGIAAPNIVSAQAANLRLHYYDEYLYFDYIDTTSVRATLALAFDLGAATRGEAPGGWLWDVYTPGCVFHYGEEGSGIHALLIGGADGHLYQYAGNSDNGIAISMEFTTPSKDQGDPRSNKLYGDIMLDSNTQGVNATATPYLNNNAMALTAVTVNTATRSQNALPLGASWQTAKNISLNVVTLVSTSARPFFFIWEPRWTFESAPISAISWEISPTSFGMEGFKHFGLCKVTHVSTSDLTLTFTVDGVAQAGITVANGGGVYSQTIFRVPVMKGKLYKLRIASSNGTAEFRLDTRDTFFEVKDWASDGEYQKLRIFGDFSMVEG